MTETASPQNRAAATLLVDSPPAVTVSLRCAVESSSSIEAAKPDKGAVPEAEPTPEESITRGIVPESAEAIAARRAEGPLPMTTMSHDSMFTPLVAITIAS